MSVTTESKLVLIPALPLSVTMQAWTREETPTTMPWPPLSEEVTRSTEAWVESPGAAYFEDDSLVIASERSGWRHLYEVSKGGREWRAITSGDWEVRRVLHVDREAGEVYFMGTKDSHLAENLYMDLSGSGVKVQQVNPGFIKTRLTDKNAFDMPYIITPEEAARRTLNAMKSRRFATSYPWQMAAFFRLGALMPIRWFRRLMGA